MRLTVLARALAVAVALAGIAIALSPFLSALDPKANLGVAVGGSLFELKPVLSSLVIAAGASLLLCAVAMLFSSRTDFPVIGMALAAGVVLALGTAQQFFPSRAAERTYSLLSMRGDATLIGLAAAAVAILAAAAILVLRDPDGFRPVLREPSPHEG